MGYQVPGGTLSSFGNTVIFIEYSEISNFGIDAYSFWASYNIPTLPLALEASYTNIDYDGSEALDRLSAKISYLIPNSTVKPYLEVENLDSGFVNETLYGIGVTFNIGPSKPKATTKYGLKSAALLTFLKSCSLLVTTGRANCAPFLIVAICGTIRFPKTCRREALL